MLGGQPGRTPPWRRIFSLADTSLAARIERFAAASQRAFAEANAARFPALGSVWVELSGAIAAFLEPGSPVNNTFGLGMARAVSASDLRTLERFFAERGEQPLASVCPHTHPSTLRALGSRGWTPAAFENVLVRAIDPADRFEPAPGRVDITIARTESEIELWAALAANGFSAPEDPLPVEMRLARSSADVHGAVALIGYVDGVAAGCGELTIDGEIAWLSTDATLPQFRRVGVQAALQRARLELARDAGCSLAVTESMPGSGSQRNMERLGFDVVYTRVEVLGPAAPRGR